MKIDARLRVLSEEIRSLETEAAILDEQIVFQQGVTEDARIRALVSETPLADREEREARDVLVRLIRSRDEARERLARMRAEVDELLERLTREG